MSVKSLISSHVRISYCFYQFVTTQYTTDFYIVKNYMFQAQVLVKKTRTFSTSAGQIFPAKVLAGPSKTYFEPVPM